MTSLHWRTVTAHMRGVLEAVGQSDLVPDFYLAGGTALALQIGHRRSIDLDFFSATDEVRPETHRRAARVLAPFLPVTARPRGAIWCSSLGTTCGWVSSATAVGCWRP